MCIIDNKIFVSDLFYAIFTICSFFIHTLFIIHCYSIDSSSREQIKKLSIHILINFFIIASGVPDAGGTPHFRELFTVSLLYHLPERWGGFPVFQKSDFFCPCIQKEKGAAEYRSDTSIRIFPGIHNTKCCGCHRSCSTLFFFIC